LAEEAAEALAKQKEAEAEEPKKAASSISNQNLLVYKAITKFLK
jgi:hypothetical protein